eukprot:7914539-Alexandrium_andersonii.AAC.1
MPASLCPKPPRLGEEPPPPRGAPPARVTGDGLQAPHALKGLRGEAQGGHRPTRTACGVPRQNPLIAATQPPHACIKCNA